MPPLRLSTFDPFGSSGHLVPDTPTTPDERRASHSPRLEARGSEPIPPPPPPRWCKPPLVSTTESSPPPDSMKKEAQKLSETMVAHELSIPVKRELRRPIQRRRKARRRRSAAPLSPQCHHSSLADKASDYEDIWGTSPTASQDEDESIPVVVLANEEDTALSDRPEEEEPDIRDVVSLSNHSDTSGQSNRRQNRSSRSSISSTSSSNNSSGNKSSSISSSNSTLEKMTSVSSDRPRPLPASRSISSSPEPIYFDQEEPEEIKPPSPFREKEEEEPHGLAVTIIEIRDSPTIHSVEKVQDNQPEVLDNKENVPEEATIPTIPANLSSTVTTETVSTEVTVRRRTSCSSTESRGDANSKRTSPLYSEPADALPPQLAVSQARLKNNQQGRPLPLPPLSSASTDFTTFTKDGYVRCTLPSLTQSQSNPRVNVLPPTGQRSATNHRAKQISMPKPPLPPGTIESAGHGRTTFPAMIYLPPSGDDSLTIQVPPRLFIIISNNCNEFRVDLLSILNGRTGSVDGLVPVGGLGRSFSSSTATSSTHSTCRHISFDQTTRLGLR